MDPRRLGIRPKLTGIYLIIAIPLLVALGLSIAARYNEHVQRAIQERQDVARFAADGFVSQMESLGTTMRFVIRHALDERRTSPEIADELATISNDFPVQYSAMLDSSGRVIGSTEPSLLGQDLSGRSEVAPLLEANRLLAASDVTTGLRGDRGFYLAAALTTQRGDVRGIITSFIPLETLQVQAGSLLRTGFAHIVDSSGALVYSSRDPRYITLETDWAKAPFVRDALRGRAVQGWFTHPVTGERVLVAEIPISIFHWTAGSAIPASQVLSAQRQQLLALVALVVAVQIAVLTLVVVLSSRLVKPLAVLVEDSRAVGEGDFSRPIKAHTGDEIESLASAMDQTRLKLKRYVEGLSALSQTGRALAATLTTEDLDGMVVSGATELFGATEVWILREQEGRFVPRLLHGTDLEEATIGQNSATTGMLADIMRGGAPRVIADVRTLPPSDWARRASARDIRSVALLPLRSPRLEAYGMLGLAAPQVMPWAEERREQELLEIFAAQVSDALENVRLFEQVHRLAEDNARLYEGERDVALRLQESLLRIPSVVPGVRFHHLYRAALSATLVGGDFFDLFELGAQRLGVAVGDVSGKGLAAATLISFVKSSLRAYAYEGHTPAGVMASINDAVGRLSDPSEFVTAFFGSYDCATGKMTYCSAGHPPAVIRRGGRAGEGAVETLPSGSPILGAFRDVTFEDGETSLQPGDTLLLYTDGVSEARDAQGTLFGTARIVETVREAAPEADLTQVVFDRVLAYTDGQLSDDIAMLALSPEEGRSCEIPR